MFETAIDLGIQIRLVYYVRYYVYLATVYKPLGKQALPSNRPAIAQQLPSKDKNSKLCRLRIPLQPWEDAITNPQRKKAFCGQIVETPSCRADAGAADGEGRFWTTGQVPPTECLDCLPAHHTHIRDFPHSCQASELKSQKRPPIP